MAASAMLIAVSEVVKPLSCKRQLSRHRSMSRTLSQLAIRPGGPSHVERVDLSVMDLLAEACAAPR